MNLSLALPILAALVVAFFWARSAGRRYHRARRPPTSGSFTDTEAAGTTRMRRSDMRAGASPVTVMHEIEKARAAQTQPPKGARSPSRPTGGRKR